MQILENIDCSNKIIVDIDENMVTDGNFSVNTSPSKLNVSSFSEKSIEKPEELLIQLEKNLSRIFKGLEFDQKDKVHFFYIIFFLIY